MSSRKLEVKLNDPQYDIFDKIENLDYIYEIGGRWSGKTYGILQMMVLIGFLFPGYRWICFRKVYASIRDTVYDELKGVIEDFGFSEDDYTHLKSPLYIKIPNGAEFLFKGMDSVDKNKGLARCHGAFLEELNEFTEMDFEGIDNGIRGKGFQHIIFMAHNPVPLIPGMEYWFQRMFGKPLNRGEVEITKETGLGQIARLKTSYLDNKYCPQKRKERLEGYKDTNPELYKLWALGEYAEMKGAILKNWDVVKSAPTDKPLIGYGLDFGFSEDPAACVKVWGDKKEIWVQGMLYSTGLSNEELYTKMIDGEITSRDKIIADSAEPKSIDYLFRSGLRGIRGAKKRANYKTEMANVLKSIIIHLVDGDTDLQREVAIWSWDEDKTGKLLPRPKDGNDHYIDAIIMLMHDYRGSRKMSLGSF